MALQRYLVDGQTPGTADTFSGLVTVNKRYNRNILTADGLNPGLDEGTEQYIRVAPGVIISLYNSGWRSFNTDFSNTLVGVESLDTGVSFQVGRDYYVYLVDKAPSPKFVISLNSSYPQGESASNTRKIGGFHYGHVRGVTSHLDSPPSIPCNTGGSLFNPDEWGENVGVGIIPNSVWDLENRPRCSPEGMVKVGNLWVDIYQSSALVPVTLEPGGFVQEGLLQSKYGQLPFKSDDLLVYYMQFSFYWVARELATWSGKRLMTPTEWFAQSYGSPNGRGNTNEYGWTKSTNTACTRTGCNVTAANGNYAPGGGEKPFAVSAHNTVDCVGNLHELVDAFDFSPWTHTTDTASIGYLGHDRGKSLGFFNPVDGRASTMTLVGCGGNFNFIGNNASGIAGARTLSMLKAPSMDSVDDFEYPGLGVRLACEPL